jgi:hypothetical protein
LSSPRPCRSRDTPGNFIGRRILHICYRGSPEVPVQERPHRLKPWPHYFDSWHALFRTNLAVAPLVGVGTTANKT